MSRDISQEKYSIWSWFLVHLCKMAISLGFFFIFSKFWFLEFLGANGQKIVQNSKKFCPSRSISQESYIIWLSFMVNVCKMIISPGFFFSFSKFWFFGLLGGGSKKWSKMTRNSVCCISYLGKHTSYDCHLWYAFVKW